MLPDVKPVLSLYNLNSPVVLLILQHSRVELIGIRFTTSKISLCPISVNVWSNNFTRLLIKVNFSKIIYV